MVEAEEDQASIDDTNSLRPTKDVDGEVSVLRRYPSGRYYESPDKRCREYVAYSPLAPKSLLLEGQCSLHAAQRFARDVAPSKWKEGS